jgi:hypothetical protein
VVTPDIMPARPIRTPIPTVIRLTVITIMATRMAEFTHSSAGEADGAVITVVITAATHSMEADSTGVDSTEVADSTVAGATAAAVTAS